MPTRLDYHIPPRRREKSITSKQLDKLFNLEVENVYAHDVIDVARQFGWFDGKDKDFSFSDICSCRFWCCKIL
ncbi:MAG: hypothetical protein R2744_00315 [Bacteroidales bacterium]